ncbi:SIS domain-containing protein [Enemella sp. A6]|uniref:SIS domain-containing protein n=1 Tax=Enemella sp. A6 TaxID=3440152 RepID=UPI003EBE0543
MAGLFDDARLEDEQWLARIDAPLRHLAELGARLRREADAAAAQHLTADDRPRAVVAAGSEARLIRALLEPTCPVPFVAWPSHGLPGWVGPLDLVIVLATDGSDPGLVATVREAVRRGARLLVACPPGSLIAEHAAARGTTMLPMHTGDTLAAVLLVLSCLHDLGLGPRVDIAEVADAVDQVAIACSPSADLAANRAKELACALADAQPLVWGGSVLAARASRRIAEALRAESGRPALAADARELLPIINATTGRDLFADPFDDPAGDRRPVLVVCADGPDDEIDRAARTSLMAAADRRDVRVAVIDHDAPSAVARYAAVLQEGRFAALYLGLGLADEQ